MIFVDENAYIATIGNPIVKNWLTLKTHKIRGENGDYYLQLFLKIPIKKTTEIATASYCVIKFPK